MKNSLFPIMLLLALYTSTASAQTPGGVQSNIGFWNISGDYHFTTALSPFSGVADIANKLTGFGSSTIYTGSSNPLGAYDGYIYTGNFTVPTSGTWTLTLESDDGSDLAISNGFYLNNDGDHSCSVVTGSSTFNSGTVYTFTLRHYNNAGPSCLNLRWEGPGFGGTAYDIPINFTNTLRLWTRANNASAGGTFTWIDNTSNAQHLTSSGANRPTLQPGTGSTFFNYNPYLEFNKAGDTLDRLQKSGFTGFGTNALSYFTVVRRANTTRDEAIVSYAKTSDDNEFLISKPNNIDVYVDRNTGAATNVGYNIANNLPNLLSVIHVSTTASGTNNFLSYLNGNGASPYVTTYQYNSTASNTGTLVLGQEQDNEGGGFDINQAFVGDIAEVIQFNRAFYPGERERIESYLAIKYGITMAQNYLSSNGTTIYTTAAPFTNNIFGIGRDFNSSRLVQGKSVSVLAPTLITVENASYVNTAANDLDYLVIGDDGALTDQANQISVLPTVSLNRHIYVTARKWKVQNTGFSSSVTLSVNGNLVLNSFDATKDYFLIVGNDPAFSAIDTIVSPTSTAGGILQFNVTFAPNTTKYFRIGRSDGYPPTVAFFNHDPAPAFGSNIWEACANSDIRITYEGFFNYPTHIAIATKTGRDTIAFTDPGVIDSIYRTTRVPQAGSVRLNLPNDATTGIIEFLYFNGSTYQTIYQTNSFLVVNNPDVDMTLSQVAPYCSSDTIGLLGTPLGGYFTAALATGYSLTPTPNSTSNFAPVGPLYTPTFVPNSIIQTYGISGSGTSQTGAFLPINLFLDSAYNQGSVGLNITYNYSPPYLTIPGATCPPKPSTTNITASDNRLYNVNFNFIVAQANPFLPTEFVQLDTLLDTTNFLPNLNHVTGLPNTLAFLGSNIQTVGVAPNLNYNFRYGNSPGVYNHIITVTYDNAGCLASRNGRVTIIPPIHPLGLDSIYCNQAGLITFYRDPLFRDTLAYDTLDYHANGQPATIIHRHSYILVTDPYIAGSPSAITRVSGGINTEQYTFNPAAMPVNLVRTILFNFATQENVYTFNSAGVPLDTIVLDTAHYTARYKIKTVYRDTARIDNSIITDFSDHCSYALPVALHSTPYFGMRDSRYYTRYNLFERSSYRGDSLQQDTIVHFDSIYVHQAAAIGPNRDAPMRLIYSVHKYGCSDYDTLDFQVRAPLAAMAIYGRHTFDTLTIGGIRNNNYYCRNETNDFIFTSPPRNTGSGTIDDSIRIVHNGVTTFNVSNSPPIFNPTDTGSYAIRYIFWDIYSCRNITDDTFFVKKPVNTALALAGTVAPALSFCGTDLTYYQLSVQPTANLLSPPTVSYSGFGVTNDSFRPASAFPNTSGWIIANSTDSAGCPTIDSMQINLIPQPVLQLLTDTTTGAELFKTSICRNNSLFRIYPSINNIETPSSWSSLYITAFSLTGRRNALQSDTVNRMYYYNVANANPTASTLDTLVFSITLGSNCTYTMDTTIRLDSVPKPKFLNLRPYYCQNDTAFTIRVAPDSLSGTAGFITASPTIGTNLSTNPTNASSSRFVPRNSQLGRYYLTYTFTDGHGCTEDTTRSFDVLPLPNTTFSGLNLQYCSTSPVIQLHGNHLAVTSGAGVSEQGRYWIDTTSRLLTMTPTHRDTGYIRPDTIGVGAHTIYYAFSDSMGCKDTSRQNFFIHPIPNVDIVGVDSAYCKNSLPDQAIGVPSGSTGSLSSTFLGTATPSSGFTLVTPSTSVANFNPSLAQAGLHRLFYTYTDPVTTCSNLDSFILRVFPAVTPTITGLPSSYCEVRDTIHMTGFPAGGRFAGIGVPYNTNTFIPVYSGPGSHIVQYTVSDTFSVGGTSVVCENVALDTITINPLPRPAFLNPISNGRYCITDTSLYQFTGQLLSTPGHSPTRDTIFRGAGIWIDIDTIYIPPVPPSPFGTFYADSTYYFNPSLAGYGSHRMTMVATNTYGCVDSVNITLYVDSIPAVEFTPLDSAYCENESGFALVGSPLGGIFKRDGTILTNYYFSPNPNYDVNNLASSIGTTQVDTIKYIYQFSGVACADSFTQVVVINPIPPVNYVGENATNQYCKLDDSIALTPNVSGGYFAGNGVVFNNYLFSPILSGVGEHKVSYVYTDTTTGCSGTYTDTIFVYSQPDVEFLSLGSCQDQLVVFRPDNILLGMNGIFQNSIYDSITSVQWNFGEGLGFQAVNPLDSTAVDTISHQFAAPGAYTVFLSVTNHGICSDMDSLRLVVVPKVTAFPYTQDFNNTDGAWLAEDQGQFSSSVWEWGVPNNIDGGIDYFGNQALHDKVWMTTLNNGYPRNKDAWVYSPCFDLTTLDRPMIALDYWSHTYLGTDGTVIEFRNELGEWEPLGLVGRGINWYNSPVILGTPGAQTLAPRGWSGVMDSFRNARYSLDSIRYWYDSTVYKNFQFRVSFGSANIQQPATYDGFAFDNVWLGNRTRQTLAEHFSNVSHPNMNGINQHVYDVCFHTNSVRDAILVEYHTDAPDMDEFHTFNHGDHSSRIIYYGNPDPAELIIDGVTNLNSADLSTFSFESSMLETPKFDISIDTFYTSGNIAVVEATVTALEDLPASDRIVQIAILEDSLTYTGTNVQVNTVLRQLLPAGVGGAGTLFPLDWGAGDSQPLSYSWTFDPSKHNTRNFSAVAFIQNHDSRVVYQAASSRDLTRFTAALGVNQITPQAWADAKEVSNLKLFPNPNTGAFQVSFEKPLSKDYGWKLYDLRGVEIIHGIANQGTQQLHIQTQDLPEGMYIFILHTNEVETQRSVIITRP